jgi:hypothetical protein
MSVGRPTDYLPEYADQLREYFDIEAGRDVEVENSKGEMQAVRHAADFPTLAEFACKIGVHRETLLEWSKKYPEFSDAYKSAKDHQERILVQNGLKGGYHANFAIFTAKNVLDWRDKSERDLNVGGQPNNPFQVVERTIVRTSQTDNSNS